jgi:hypothetical protein
MNFPGGHILARSNSGINGRSRYQNEERDTEIYISRHYNRFLDIMSHRELCCSHSSFHSTLRYIDDVLSINNDQFHSHIDSIYPSELEIKDTTESSTSASYLDVLLNKDADGKLTTQLYDKRYDFSFHTNS